MAHLEKFNKAQIGQMLSHYDRGKANIGNPEIDKNRTHLNYNLATHQKLKQGDFIKERCSKVKVQNRKDVNLMCDWIVTVPKDLDVEKHKEFFKNSYDFLEKRYGKENVISAYVHLDETTPHMHFSFMPVTQDLKKGGYKISAKEVVNRKDLSSFHLDLSNYLEKQMQQKVNVLNEATKDGNKTIQELKRNSYIENIQKLKLQEAQAFNIVETRLKTYDTIIAQNKSKFNDVESYKVTRKIFGKEDIVEVPKKDFDNLVKVAELNSSRKNLLIELNKHYDESVKKQKILANKLNSNLLKEINEKNSQIKDLRERLNKAEKQILLIREVLINAQKELIRYKSAIKELPQIAKEKFVEIYDKLVNRERVQNNNFVKNEQIRAKKKSKSYELER